MIGKSLYDKFKRGERLTYREAIVAQCYVCNGLDEGGEDCNGKSCPLYQYMPYRVLGQNSKKAFSTEHKRKLGEALKRHRENKNKAVVSVVL